MERELVSVIPFQGSDRENASNQSKQSKDLRPVQRNTPTETHTSVSDHHALRLHGWIQDTPVVSGGWHGYILQ